jgi:hypothetical protein
MYILYKNPVQIETLNIVQYLHYNKISFLPNTIIERNHPQFVSDLPTIVYNNKQYNGLEAVVSLYEECSGINNLLEKSYEFKKQNPKYTIKL